MTTIPSHTEVFRNVNIVVVQEVQSMSTLLLFRKCVNVNIAVVQEVQSMSTLLLFNFLSSSVPQWNFSALKSFSRLQ